MPKQPQPPKNSSFWQGAKFPVAVAHRGGDAAGFAKRNTMVAFESARKLGFKYIETDVTLTKDGQVIISHGSQTAIEAYFRGTFSYRKLRSLSYEDIRRKLKVDGEPIPLLIDVLKAFPNTKFFIDPKSDDVVEPLAKVLIEQNAVHRVFIDSFKYHRLMDIQKLLGGKQELGLTIGRHFSLVKKLYRLRMGRLAHLEVISVNYWFATRRRLKLIHSQDLKACVWTLNSRKNIKRAINNGADIIISDRTVVLKELVEL